MMKLIERIKRLVIEVGDCWEWQGALQSRAPTPAMNFNGKVKGVRRHIAEQRGVNLEGKLATHSCGNELCVNPDHVIVVTRKRLQTRLAKEMKHQTNALRRKKLSDKARLYSKITAEIAEEIRNSDENQRVIAVRYGISQATVSSIKTGKTWRDYSNPFVQLIPGRTK